MTTEQQINALALAAAVLDGDALTGFLALPLESQVAGLAILAHIGGDEDMRERCLALAHREGYMRTPGPWSVSDRVIGADNGDIGIRNAKGRLIAFVYAGADAADNLRLICAAPDLLEALEPLLESYRGLNVRHWQQAVAGGHAAIVKAKARPPEAT